MSQETPALDTLRNRTFDQIAIGDQASITRTLTSQDLALFAVLSGDGGEPVAGSGDDPGTVTAAAVTDDTDGGAGSDGHSVAAGMWAGSWLAALLASQLPGPGTVYRRQQLHFLAPLEPGQTLTLTATVTAREAAGRGIVLAVTGTIGKADAGNGPCTVLEGEVEVTAPAQTIERKRTTLPDIQAGSGRGAGLRRLLDHARHLHAVPTAVIHPCDVLSLSGALAARDEGLIEPVLVAPLTRLHAAADEAGLSLDGIRLIDVPHSHAAAFRAAELAREGEVEVLMKGSLHTDELMAAVVASASGLRTKRRVSHCFVLQTPHYPRPFIVTDAAINLAPDLPQKADIIRNAIDLAHVIGVARPKVAILAAVETVTPGMPATLDAAALCKMADRGQIRGAVLDGPLAFDNAVSIAAAHTKGIESAVAGQADILVVPDLESGNMLAKQLIYMGEAESAGIVIGAKVPVILTSRADSADSRLASCAIALMLAHHYRTSPP